MVSLMYPSLDEVPQFLGYSEVLVVHVLKDVDSVHALSAHEMLVFNIDLQSPLVYQTVNSTCVAVVVDYS